MNHGNAGAIAAPPRMGRASRLAASIGGARVAWHSLTWAHFWWTLCIGSVGGILFLAAHGMRRILGIYLHRFSPEEVLQECAIAVGVSIVVAFLFLLAVSVAERGDRGQPHAWPRYLVAVLVAVCASTALVHVLSPYLPLEALFGWYLLEGHASIDAFVFSNWLLFGGLAVFVYVRLRRVRRSQAAFEYAELERATASRRVLRSQLATIQAQVEPTFLFNTLSQVEALYEHHAGSADRVLEDLIAYLRAALPQLRGEGSTLARECELAEAYLRIVEARMGSRLQFAFDIAPEIGATRFPPMLLLPLVDNAVRHGLEPLPHGGRIEVRAAAYANRLRLTVFDNGLGGVIEFREGHGLTTLRERLAALYGQEATLSVSASRPHGVTATIEVPRHERASDHR